MQNYYYSTTECVNNKQEAKILDQYRGFKREDFLDEIDLAEIRREKESVV